MNQLNHFPPGPPNLSRRIIVASLDPQLAVAVDRWFSNQGYTVVATRSGTAAINAMQNAWPSVFILQSLLPDLTALEVCHALNRHPEARRTPRLLLTSSQDEIDSAQVYLAGINQFLARPFQQMELKQRISSLLSRSAPPKRTLGQFRPDRTHRLRA